MYGASRPTRKTFPRVSYVIRSPVQQHCLGINNICFDSTGGRLFSSGRDGSLIEWNVSKSKETKFVKSFEGHADWVNDAFLCSDERTLISCSSDHLIKSWDANTGDFNSDIFKHIDYVKCLAYARDVEKFASGGFDKMIHLWDIETAKNTGSLKIPSAPSVCLKHSVYSMSCNSSGSVLVSGTAENIVRAWDPRTGNKICKLKGHRDNIRALVLNQEGSMCISASSDQTIRLWDLGQQRCVQTYYPHTDSVWSLCVDQGFVKVLSGSRDGSVFVTDLKTKTSVLVCKLQTHVHKAIPNKDWTGIWVATPESTFSFWEYNQSNVSLSRASTLSVSASPSSFSSSITEPEADLVPVVAVPSETIQGKPGIIKHRICNNKRHILTSDTNGNVALWDVTKGIQVADYGKIDFDSKVDEMSIDLLHVPNWFTVDTRMGSLSIHMENHVCFNAEIYATDADIEVPHGEEIKINLGDRTLRSLFAGWLAGRKQILQQAESSTLGKESGQEGTATAIKGDATSLQQGISPGSADQQVETDSSEVKRVNPLLGEKKLNDQATEPSKPNQETPQNPKSAASPTKSYSLSLFQSNKGKKNADTVAAEKRPSQSPPKSLEKGKEADESKPESDEKKEENTLASDIPATLSFSSLASALNPNGANPQNTTLSGPSIPQSTVTQITSQSLPPWPFPPEIQVFITEEGYTQSFRVGDFKGDETVIPEWVDDCLIHEKFAPKEQHKLGFYLVPVDVAQTPSLPHGNNRLLAHRVLKIKKIAAYIINKVGIALPKDPNNPARALPAEEAVEIFCNDQALEPSMNLGTIRHYYWKGSDEMPLKYRFRF